MQSRNTSIWKINVKVFDNAVRLTIKKENEQPFLAPLM